MSKLIKTVLRKFYSPIHAIIMDTLLEKLISTEAELCASLKLIPREFNKNLAILKKDRLIKHESKIEIIEGRQNLKQVYYLDFRQIKDCIKYKIFMITKSINEKLRNTENSYDLYCSCSKRSLLEAQALMKDFKFICDVCSEELKQRIEDEDPYELQKLFMKECKAVIDLLKEADKLELETIDYFQVIENKKKMGTEKVEESVGMKNIFGEDLIIKEVNVEESKTEKIEDIVHVKGVPKLFTEITEEDKENMEEEEYEKYFEIHSKYFDGN